MYCRKCGKEAKDNTKFCVYCGEPLKEMTQNASGNTVEKKGKSGIVWLLIVVFLLFAIVIVGLTFVLFNKQKQENSIVNKTRTEKTTKEEAETEDNEEKEESDGQEELEGSKETVKNPMDLSVSECEQTIDEMLESEFTENVSINIMMDISNVIVESRVAGNKGVRLSDMTDDEKNSLNYWIARGAYHSGRVFEGEVYFDEKMTCNAQSFLSLANAVYGADELPEKDSMMITWVDEDNLQFMMADGDEVPGCEGVQIREKDNLYLASSPIFMYDNYSYTGSRFIGYSDVLFYKNEDSRFGVTALYARTRDKKNKNVDYVETSSVLESGSGKSYGGNNLIDGNFSTAWVEGTSGVGVGETITLHMSQATEVYGILLYNGYLDCVDLYDKNGKVAKVRVDFGQGTVIEKEIGTGELYKEEGGIEETDMNIGQIGLERSVMTDTITITILDAVAGYKYDDTCISEVVVY